MTTPSAAMTSVAIRRAVLWIGTLLILLIVAIDAYEAWADWRVVISQVGGSLPSASEALARWRSQEIESGIRTLSLAALAAAFLAGLLHALKRRDAAEEERLRLNNRLQEMQSREALGFFAASVAHDFNNILGAIDGYGELARDSVQTPSAARLHLDRLLAASERARKLVRRVLTFDGQRSLSYAPVNVGAVVAEALEQLRLTLPPGVTLKVTALLPSAQVMGDPVELHQIIANLCMNAAQAMPQGGGIELALEATQMQESRTLTVGSLTPGNWLSLCVTDTGVGLDTTQLQTIFQPFYTTRTPGLGTGIGLTVVRNIVTSMGGAVHVASRRGGPTRFSIYFPAVNLPPPQTERRHERGRGEVVLVVDNEPALVAIAEEMLATLGYEPVGFADPVRALAALRADPDRFDALLSDERMPELAGTTLAAAARAVSPGLPVVLMTAYRDAGLPARADAAGVAVVLEKPLQSNELAAAMHRFLKPCAA